MLTKAAKMKIVKEFNQKFEASPSLFVVEYKGLNVGEMEGLRKKLREANAELKVVKNTLLRIASEDTEVEKIKELFVGPTAISICDEDPASVAKVFAESAKDLPVLEIKGGIVEGKVVGDEEISELSKLPSREVLFAQFLGLLSEPLSKFAATLNQLQSRLVYALNAVKEKKEGE